MRRIVAFLAIVAILAPAARSNPQPVLAQGPAPIHATLFTNTVRWRTVPDSVVLAELSDADGVHAAGTGFADASGDVSVRLFDSGDDFPGNAYVRPGDTLRLAPLWGEPIGVTVPRLLADANEADVVAGLAPPGGEVTIEVDYGPGGSERLSRTITAATDGTFRLDLAGSADLRPGDSGAVQYLTPDGHRFTALFAVFAADLTLGAQAVRGQASLGTSVAVAIASQPGAQPAMAASEVTDSTSWQLPGRFSFSPGFGPVAPGSVVTLTQSASVLGPDREVSVVVPGLTIEIDRNANTVRGTGPADTDLTIELLAPDGQVTPLPARTDAAGAFELPVGTAVALGPGWRAAVVREVEAGFRVKALAAVTRIRVGVHARLVSGVATPGRPVTVTVFSAVAPATPKLMERTSVDDQGRFDVQFFGFGPNQPAAIAPGDQVEVDFAAGDPIVLLVPELTAVADVAGDAISGQAPGGAEVQVTAGLGAGAPSVTTTADATGEYRAQLAGLADVAAPMNGTVTVRTPSGHEFFTDWAAVQMTIRIGSSFVSGNGPPDRDVRLALHDPDGRQVAAGQETIFRPSSGMVIFGSGLGELPSWFVDLADETGTAVPVQPGDELRATVGDESFTVIVPPLSGVVHVADDVVTGTTSPDTDITLRIERLAGSEGRTVALTSDDRGIFSHDFGGDFDIQYNDTVVVTSLVDGHIVTGAIAAPGMILELEEALASGSWQPNTALDVSMRNAGLTRAIARVTTDDDAVFSAAFRNIRGEPVLPEPGDEVVVNVVGEPGGPALSMTVPELTVEWEAGTAEIHGQATPGGSLNVLANETPYNLGPGTGLGQTRAVIAADGSYRAQLVPAVKLTPGTIVSGVYRLPVGHLAIRRRLVPIVNAQHGGSQVCGFAGSRAPVDLTLRNPDGSLAATASGSAGFDSWYHLRLAGAGSEPVTTSGGQMLQAQLGGDAIEVRLPELNLEIDWQSGMVTGNGPADTRFWTFHPPLGCANPFDAGMSQSLQYVMISQTDPDGSIFTFLADSAPGSGFEFAVNTADGHRVFRLVYRSLGQIYVNTDKVTGLTTPGSQVSIVLTAAGGAERARATTTADDSGRFEATLAAGGGAAVASRPTDQVSLEAGGDAAAILVEDLSFDWSPGAEVIGRAPAGRELSIALTLVDGRTMTVGRQSDARGVFGYTAADVPPRADWSLADVQRVRVVLPTPNGHEIVAETEAVEPPPSTRATIYLPFVEMSRRPVATADQRPGMAAVGRRAGVAAVGRRAAPSTGVWPNQWPVAGGRCGRTAGGRYAPTTAAAGEGGHVVLLAAASPEAVHDLAVGAGETMIMAAVPIGVIGAADRRSVSKVMTVADTVPR